MTSERFGGTGGIEDPEIRPDEMGDPEIRDSSVDDPNIRDGSVDNPDIRDGSVDNPDLRDSSVDDPDIRDGSIDNPEIRDGGIDDPELRTGVDDPDLRAGVDNPDLRTGVDNPEIRVGIDNPDIAPQPMSGGIPVIPIAIVGGLVVVAVAAFSILGGGGPSPTVGPGASPSAGVSTQPGATGPGAGSTGSGVGPGESSASGDSEATLILRGGYEDTFDDLEGSNVSPTTTLLAAVWADARTSADGANADIATLTLTGPVFSGTQSTSRGGVVLAFSVSRTDAEGNDLYLHLWTSSAGECSVTMATGAAISGSFRCTGVTSDTGITVDAEGTFRT